MTALWMICGTASAVKRAGEQVIMRSGVKVWGLMVPEQQAHIAHTVRLYTMDKYKNTTYTRECAVHMYVCMYTRECAVHTYVCMYTRECAVHTYVCMYTCVNGHTYVHKCAMSTYYSFQEFIRRHS